MGVHELEFNACLLVWELVQWLQDVVSGLLNVYTNVNVFRDMSPRSPSRSHLGSKTTGLFQWCRFDFIK